MIKNFIPRKTVACSAKEKYQLFLIGLVSVYDGLVMVLSFGHLTTDARAWLLFDYFEDDK